MIQYIKSVLWIVVKRLSYIEDARCLKVNPREEELKIYLYLRMSEKNTHIDEA